MDSLNAPKGIEAIADAVINCRFEMTNPASDEVVFMKILKVFLKLLDSPLIGKINDEKIHAFIVNCLRLCSQSRLSGMDD